MSKSFYDLTGNLFCSIESIGKCNYNRCESGICVSRMVDAPCLSLYICGETERHPCFNYLDKRCCTLQKKSSEPFLCMDSMWATEYCTSRIPSVISATVDAGDGAWWCSRRMSPYAVQRFRRKSWERFWQRGPQT